MKQTSRDTIRGHFLMLSEKVKHVERSVGGLQADQTEETLPGWAGMQERKGRHSLGIKDNKRSFYLKYTLLGCLLSRF